MKFKDLEGRELEAVVNLQTVIDVKDSLGIDLGNLAEGNLLERLHTDAALQVAVLWIVCRKSIDAHGISEPRDFASALGGDVLESAIEALENAILFFYPKERREAVRNVVRKMRELDSCVLKSAEREFGRAIEGAKELAEKEIRKQVDQALSDLTPSAPATSSLESPGSASHPVT